MGVDGDTVDQVVLDVIQVVEEEDSIVVVAEVVEWVLLDNLFGWDNLEEVVDRDKGILGEALLEVPGEEGKDTDGPVDVVGLLDLNTMKMRGEGVEGEEPKGEEEWEEEVQEVEEVVVEGRMKVEVEVVGGDKVLIQDRDEEVEERMIEVWLEVEVGDQP